MPDATALAGRPVVIGSGLAGMLAALQLAPRPCVLVSRGMLGAEASSPWAQGGIAVAVGRDDDPGLHLADTLAAGDGLCDAEAAAAIVSEGPAALTLLERHGVRFDRAADGSLLLGLEAAHSRRRIVHCGGDATGAEIVRALVSAVRACASIAVLESTVLRRLVTDGMGGPVAGVALERDGMPILLPTRSVVLATGGLGGLYADTTNPLSATGSGLALAARAGARLGDLEFVQFHPTALALGDGAAPRLLISEAVRGEGATLIDETGARFMDSELAPRDVVSRAVWHHLQAGHQVFLDCRQALGRHFATRFPGIDRACQAFRLDPATMPVPVRPAAHYFMGGIVVDGDGCSSVPGLFACGEAACTGLHGANRLASNSLLEAAVGGARVARLLCERSQGETVPTMPALPWSNPPNPAPELMSLVRRTVTQAAGVLRDEAQLYDAIATLAPLSDRHDAALAGLLVCLSAHERRESRGAHYRTDHPQRDPVSRRATTTLDEALYRVAALPAMPGRSARPILRSAS